MSNYTFEALNDKEFEHLVRDLLQKELHLTLESFRKGRDNGKDLRYSKPKSSKEDIVIQVKHYFKSGYALLKHKLLDVELKKVKRIKPERYIIVTSVSLSDNNKLELKTIFEPYILSTSDIFDLELLNNLIGKYPDIEKKHFKLWISSTNILQTILHNGINGRSEFIESKIISDIKRYVRDKNYKKALKILNKNKFLTIIGEPGIGKTLMAKFIIYKLLAENYELVYIDEKIREGEDMFIPNKKQIFYFDDFLGSNYLELIQPKNSDSTLINFIERVKSSVNKFIILTSRTTILNQAKEKFFKLKDKRIDLSKHEIKIEDYDLVSKAKILYNHLYFSELPESYIDKIVEDRSYWKILNHRNYNPRIIEFITDSYNVLEVTPNNYLNFIIDKLNNPHLIWQDAFEHQIDDYCKFLLLTLFSLPNNVPDDILYKAYDARLEYEIKNNGYCRTTNHFFSKIKELLGGFIIYQRYTDGNGFYNFFNPSLADFLIYYLNQDPNEKWRILQSAIFFEQLNLPFDKNVKNNVKLTSVEALKLLEIFRIKEKQVDFINPGSTPLKWLNLYTNIFNISIVVNDIIRLFKELNYSELSRDDLDELIEIIGKGSHNLIIKDFIIENWEEMFFELLNLIDDDYEFVKLKSLFDNLKIDYDNFIEIDDRKRRVQEYINSYWDSYLNMKINSNDDLNNSYVLHEAQEAINDIYEQIAQINSYYNIDDSPAFGKIDSLNLQDIINTNIRQREEENYVDDDYEEDNSISNMINEIDELFSK